MIVCCALLVGACGDDDSGGGSDGSTTGAADAGSTLPRGSDPVELDPADFTTEVDNRYWPMAPDGEPGGGGSCARRKSASS